jgi:hypothetical protein
MVHRVALIRIDVSKVCIASIIRLTIGELGTALAVASNRSTLGRLVTAKAVRTSPILVTLLVVAVLSFETSLLARATRRIILHEL